jgi:peroxiredoxin
MAAPRLWLVVAVPLFVIGCGKSGDDYPAMVSPSVFKDDAPANAKVSADTLPTNLVDHTGAPVDLTAYRDKKNLVLVITRGIPQSPGGVPCPYCVAQANSLTANLVNFKARDAEVLILFPGPSGQINDFIEQAAPAKKALPYPLVLDKDMAVCDRLGVRGDLAKPSTYILDKKGNVVYAYVGETRTDRPSVKAILAQLDKVNGGPPTPPTAPPTAPK